MLAMGADWPWLSLLIVSSLFASAVITVLRPEQARWVACITLAVDAFIAIIAVSVFEPTAAGFQLQEIYRWIPSLNIQYHLGVDGFSLLFLPLLVFIVVGVLVASWNSVHQHQRLYYSALLCFKSALIGVFCALDMVLFFLFWELSLIPSYLLINRWGVGEQRRFAAVKYTLTMLIGGGALLFGIVVLAVAAGGGGQAGLQFNYLQLLQTPLDPSTEGLVYFLLLIGFLLKTPVVPFHTWLTLLSQHSPIALLALITGFKIGAYGVIRFAIPLAPNVAQSFHWLLLGLGAAGMLYMTLVALAQTNLRRLVACLSISHAGLVLVGVATFSFIGVQGAMYQLLSFSLISGGLFIVLAFVYARTQTHELASLGGLYQSMPRLTMSFFVLALAFIGVPTLAGFPGEFLMIMAVFQSQLGIGLAALFVLIVSAAAVLSAYRRGFLGRSRPHLQKLTDWRPREAIYLLALLLVVVIAGLFPRVWLSYLAPVAEAWIRRL